MAAAASETKAVAISGPLASTIATRSPRPIPSSFNRAPVRSTKVRKPPWVSDTRPGAPIALASAPPAAIRSTIVVMVRNVLL